MEVRIKTFSNAFSCETFYQEVSLLFVLTKPLPEFFAFSTLPLIRLS